MTASNDASNQNLEPIVELGETLGLDYKTGNEFWKKLGDKVAVKAIIKIREIFPKANCFPLC